MKQIGFIKKIFFLNFFFKDDVSKQIKATKDISTENFHGGDNSDDEDLLLLFLNSDEDNETKKSSIKNEESDKFKDFIREVVFNIVIISHKNFLVPKYDGKKGTREEGS